MTIETAHNALYKTPKKKNEKVQQMKNVLKQDFPNCFKSGNEKLPLKIGIHLQIHFHYKDDPRFEPQLIQKGLNSYASSPKYLAKIVEGAHRVDIHGNPAGQVTAEEATHASKMLAIRQKESIKAIAKAPEKKQILILSPTPNNKINAGTQAQAKTKEEIKKAKRDHYEKKMAHRKEKSKKNRS